MTRTTGVSAPGTSTPDELAGIADPVERARAAHTASVAYSTHGDQVGDMRDALIYHAVDRFDTRYGWTLGAIQQSGMSPNLWYRILNRRIETNYGDPNDGRVPSDTDDAIAKAAKARAKHPKMLQGDLAAQLGIDVPTLRRRLKLAKQADAVARGAANRRQLPVIDPADLPDTDLEFFARIGDLHEQAVAADKQWREAVAIRNAAIGELTRTNPSNAQLAELLGVDKQVVGKARAATRVKVPAPRKKAAAPRKKAAKSAA